MTSHLNKCNKYKTKHKAVNFNAETSNTLEQAAAKSPSEVQGTMTLDTCASPSVSRSTTPGPSLKRFRESGMSINQFFLKKFYNH